MIRTILREVVLGTIYFFLVTAIMAALCKIKRREERLCK